jgi:ferric iron reductase protein FhuF
VGTSGKIPDVIGVRHDGRVDAFEVQSKSDEKEDLEKRLEEGMETLPEERRGDFAVIPADPSIKGGLLSR